MVLRAGSQDLERSAVGDERAEVCAQPEATISSGREEGTKTTQRETIETTEGVSIRHKKRYTEYTAETSPSGGPIGPARSLDPLALNTNPFLGPFPSGAQYRNYHMQDNTVQMYPLIQVANPQAAEAEDVGEAEAEGEEEAISVKKISVIIVKIMDTGNVIAERNNVTRDTIEDSSKEEEEKLKELPPELWSEGPADYIQTASFGLRLRFKDGAESDDSTLYDLKPATLLPTAEEGHQHNCLDEVSTKVLPRPDLNSTPQEPIQPGDYVWVKKFVRKRWNTPRWEGPYQVQLTTKTAVRVDGNCRGYTFHIVKNRKFFQVKAREQWRTLRKRLTACIGPATAEPRRNL
ncbi:hypothetical protein D4764_0268640 [Takifugu flavidus]|uniref:Murine leukemia virus integrase C-terminal domain-containing protein n=1 Tax=Takifugu flavidus TaxID=433684 RepID=A0A5C6MFA1_9TELE|nr:hypothetical protein D4764_0268640 [Takifugu flavidus]